jgi:hypothetical protein
MLPDTEARQAPAICALEHRLFRTLAEVLFRRAEADETPVMVMSLGERTAAVPLRALQNELGIADDSRDGRMFGLIAQSLDFVTGLQIGDTLPAEVLDGRASWTPGATHRALAAARLRLQLAAWLRPEAAGGVMPDAVSVRRLDEDPAMRQHVNAAMEQAARDLGLADRSAVVGLLETLAEELSYIEALREGLLNRVGAMVGRVERIFRTGRFNQKRMEMLTQVRRLSAAALQQITARFDALDNLTREVVDALAHLDNQRNQIRSSRDWLYRLSRAWEPILQDWEDSGELEDAGLWQLIERTYRFLAPRYMAVQEWQAFVAGQRPGQRKPVGPVMTW